MLVGLWFIVVMIVISGMIDRFWNSRIEKVCLLNGVCICFDDCSIGSICVVDDSVSGSLSVNVVGSEKCVLIYMIVLIVSLYVIICIRLSLKIFCFICYSCDGFSLSLMMNSSSVMLSLVIFIFDLVLLISFSICGFMIVFVMR